MTATHLIRDHDSCYRGGFDEVLKAEGIDVVLMSAVGVPEMNGYAASFVKTIKVECLNHFTVFSDEHLAYLLRELCRRSLQYRSASSGTRQSSHRLTRAGRGQTATARIWVYRSTAATVFRFSSTREGRHPAEFLGAYRGFIVADAYAGHERLYGPALATPVGCWAHVRRKFHDIHHHDAVAQRMVEIIQGLYTIEDDLRRAQPQDRQRIRQQRSVPLLAHIRQRLDHLRATTLPASDLGRAVAYAVTRWPTLTTYTDHGFLPIDNNPAENALRPWAIGRKNWLFVGSVSCGERAATLATIIENCRMHALDPYAYLCTTVAALHTGRTDYAALTPQVIAARQDAGVA